MSLFNRTVFLLAAVASGCGPTNQENSSLRTSEETPSASADHQRLQKGRVEGMKVVSVQLTSMFPPALHLDETEAEWDGYDLSATVEDDIGDQETITESEGTVTFSMPNVTDDGTPDQLHIATIFADGLQISPGTEVEMPDGGTVLCTVTGTAVSCVETEADSVKDNETNESFVNAVVSKPELLDAKVASTKLQGIETLYCNEEPTAEYVSLTSYNVGTYFMFDLTIICNIPDKLVPGGTPKMTLEIDESTTKVGTRSGKTFTQAPSRSFVCDASPGRVHTCKASILVKAADYAQTVSMYGLIGGADYKHGAGRWQANAKIKVIKLFTPKTEVRFRKVSAGI